MNTLLTYIFSTTLLYACVNGGALRGQGVVGSPSSAPGLWQGQNGYGGAPGVSGSQGTWSGPLAYPGGSGGGWSGQAGYAGASGGWDRPSVNSGSSGGWDRPSVNSGLSGGWSGNTGYTETPGGSSGFSGFLGGYGAPGNWPAATSGYTRAPGVPRHPESWSGSSGNAGHPGALGGWPATSAYTGAPGASGTWSGPNGYEGTPVGYAGPTAVPHVLPDGSIADVPEVAEARAAHLAAVQVAASDPRLSDADDGEYDPYKYGDHLHSHHDHHSRGSEGYNNGFGANVNHQMHNNNLVEKAGWRDNQRTFSSSHGNSYANAQSALSSLIAKNAAIAVTPSHVSGEVVKPYSGPLATPQVLPSGYVADTVEVSAARQNHLRALEEAEASAAKWEGKNTGWN